MCEKIREGKVMSLSSDEDTDETIPKDWEPVKKPKKKKRSYIKGGKVKKARNPKIKICKTCEQDILKNEMKDAFMFHDTYHQLRAKDYCKDHERNYNEHKCKPHWCGDCGYLTKYEIEIQKR